MKQIMLIGIGSGFGGIFRYLLSITVHKFLSRNFPFGTLVVNTIGCFLMGILFVIIFNRFSSYSESLRSLLLLGFLGGFTTFSTFSIETFNLFENGDFFYALLNILFSLMFCLILTWIGVVVGRQI